MNNSEAMERPAWWKRGLKTLQAWVAPFVGLAVVVLVFQAYHWIEKPDRPFLLQSRMEIIAKQTAVVGVGALGMTLVIISGGIDLSVGSMAALTSVLLAGLLWVMPEGWPPDRMPPPASIWHPGSPIVSLALVLLAGGLIGAVNGVLITKLKLVPFIVTLGTMLAFRGFAEWLADQGKIVVVDESLPAWITTLVEPPEKSWQLVCPAVWIVIALGIVTAAVLRYTVFGRTVFAIGSNEQAARLSGIRVDRVKICIYAIGGFFMAVAGLFYFNDQNMQGNPSSGIALELDIIAAVVIGGGSLAGGRGSILGTLLGAVTMSTLRSGCVYADVSSAMQKIIIGAIIVAAVAIDAKLHPRKG